MLSSDQDSVVQGVGIILRVLSILEELILDEIDASVVTDFIEAVVDDLMIRGELISGELVDKVRLMELIGVNSFFIL